MIGHRNHITHRYGGPDEAAVRDEARDSQVAVGNLRIQALSASMLRIEPRGPLGFEDRSTFMIVNRDALGQGIAFTR